MPPATKASGRSDPCSAAEMWRRSSMAAAPKVPAPAGVTAAPGVSAASSTSLGKHRTGHQQGSEEPDRNTPRFTHDCLLRGLSDRARPKKPAHSPSPSE